MNGKIHRLTINDDCDIVVMCGANPGNRTTYENKRVTCLNCKRVLWKRNAKERLAARKRRYTFEVVT